MTKRLEEDLGAWEQGAMPASELEARHPEGDVLALTGLHERLSLLGAEPTPDPMFGWEQLVERLPDRAERPKGIPKKLVAMVAATLLFGGTALAAPRIAPEAVDRIQDGIESLLGGQGASTVPGGNPGPGVAGSGSQGPTPPGSPEADEAAHTGDASAGRPRGDHTEPKDRVNQQDGHTGPPQGGSSGDAHDDGESGGSGSGGSGSGESSGSGGSGHGSDDDSGDTGSDGGGSDEDPDGNEGSSGAGGDDEADHSDDHQDPDDE